MEFDEMKTVYEYTSAQAVEDGILFDVTTLSDKWKNGLFNFVTMNLLGKGYIEKDGKSKINIPNILDLLNSCNQIVKKESDNFTRKDWLYTGMIELPCGDSQKVFIQQNDTGKFTIMLPEDY
jgi:hypothetical protein